MLKVEVKVYTGSHQRALRKGSQLVLTLARAPPKNEKRGTTETNEDPADVDVEYVPRQICVFPFVT